MMRPRFICLHLAGYETNREILINPELIVSISKSDVPDGTRIVTARASEYVKEDVATVMRLLLGDVPRESGVGIDSFVERMRAVPQEEAKAESG